MTSFITEASTGDTFYVDPETGQCEIIDTTFDGNLKRAPIEFKIVNKEKEKKMNELICAFGLTFLFITFTVLFSIFLTASCSCSVYEKRVDRNTINVCIIILVVLSIGLICFSKYNSIKEEKNEELKNLRERIEKLEMKGD